MSVGTALALGIVVLVSAKGTDSSSAQQGLMHNCPEPGRWAVLVWAGGDDTDTDEALDSCGEGTVAAAYYIDPLTQEWLRWFPGRPDVSDLLALDNLQGVVAQGAASAATPTATPGTSVTPPVTETATAAPYLDHDADGIDNMSDNCAFTANPGQEDTCEGVLGDACDCGDEFCRFTPSELVVGFQPDASPERREQIVNSVGATIDFCFQSIPACSVDVPSDQELTYYIALFAGFEEVVYAEPSCVSQTQ